MTYKTELRSNTRHYGRMTQNHSLLYIRRLIDTLSYNDVHFLLIYRIQRLRLTK